MPQRNEAVLETLSRTVAELCEAVWNQTLELPLVHVRDGADRGSGPSIQGQVHIMGAWTGAVVLQCSPAFASQAARRVFGASDRTPSADDVRDTIGELTNIIGGNLKSVLSDGECHLSLPIVIEGQNLSVSVPGTRTVSRHAFVCDSAPIVVTVLEANR
jgi:chemotaxis protein CheX